MGNQYPIDFHCFATMLFKFRGEEIFCTSKLLPGLKNGHGEGRERGKERLLLLSALSALSASVSQTEMPRLFTDLVAKILIS